ncbi:hypothetical protein H4R19_006674, partial [Coemansia spiralis]
PRPLPLCARARRPGPRCAAASSSGWWTASSWAALTTRTRKTTTRMRTRMKTMTMQVASLAACPSRRSLSSMEPRPGDPSSSTTPAPRLPRPTTAA